MRSVGTTDGDETPRDEAPETGASVQDATDDRWQWRRRRQHEDDINWKMSDQQQVTPDRAVATDGPADRAPSPARPLAGPCDGENNPIKSLRRQRRVEGASCSGPAVTSITPPTVPIGGADADTRWSARLLHQGQPAVLLPKPVEPSGDKNSPPAGQDDTANNNNNNNNRADVARELEDALERKRHNTVNARRRWKLLAKALRHDSSEDDQFAKFNLIEADRAGDEKDENVYVYRLYDRYRLKIRLIGPERPWTASELIGFNNTGNICVWPSEEALAYYILSRLSQFEGTSVLELGGGMTCLAGLVLAKYGQPAFVHVTDGNELSVENVRHSLVLNKFNCTIKSSVLKWEQTARTDREPPNERYHFILSADCLFFDESRSQLIDTIWQLLADEGVALITAPRRGQTLGLFLDECVARGFHYELLQCYNEAIWARHLELKQTDGYDENVHYPLLVKMYKYGQCGGGGSMLHRL